ncbi:MAG: hypothetical protein NXI20_12515 [bacterium]|nr:hypothetical protein [bacterium]
MKTQAKNLITTIAKIAMAASLVLFVILGANANSLSNNGKGNKDKNKSETIEDSLMVEDILVELEEMDLDIFELDVLQVSQEIEVYNGLDQLVFSGSTQEWENTQNPEIIRLKRKADFLLESGNTKVYKVF